MKNTGHFSEPSARIIFKQLVEGLVNLKTLGLSHSDLKPENILFDEFFTVKLADFGCAQQYSSVCSQFNVGTRSYTAPEVIEKKQYDTEKVDMFALGVLLWLLLFQNPFF